MSKDYPMELMLELERIEGFFTDMTSRELPRMEIVLSTYVQDVENSVNGRLVLNPGYLKKYNSKQKHKLSYNALMAHAYFHHAQHTLMPKWDPNVFMARIKRKLTMPQMNDIVDNVGESAAMFFTVAYLTRGMRKERNKKMFEMLGYECYRPGSSGKHLVDGNSMAINLFRSNGYNVGRTLKEFLTYEGQTRMVTLFFNKSA